MRAGQESGQLPADTELADLIDGILAAYATATDATEEQAEAAVCRGCEVVDIEIELAPAAATASSTLLDLLERADELCRSERLLTLPAPPEVARLRRWMNEQIEAQLARGDPPAPFSG